MPSCGALLTACAEDLPVTCCALLRCAILYYAVLRYAMSHALAYYPLLWCPAVSMLQHSLNCLAHLHHFAIYLYCALKIGLNIKLIYRLDLILIVEIMCL